MISFHNYYIVPPYVYRVHLSGKFVGVITRYPAKCVFEIVDKSYIGLFDSDDFIAIANKLLELNNVT